MGTAGLGSDPDQAICHVCDSENLFLSQLFENKL
jgi:hypothetical protein